MILKKNIALTDMKACDIFSGDSFENIKEVVKTLKKQNERAYIYIDPPFSIRKGMEDIYINMINLIKSIPKENVKLIIIEHMSTLEIPNTIGAFKVVKSKKFGKTTLTYIRAPLKKSIDIGLYKKRY
jgi:16S rRNA G966 N2-methylase RsmD